MIRLGRHRAEPEIPVHVLGGILLLRPGGNTLRPDRTIRPGMDFDDVTDQSRTNQFHDAAHVVLCMGLISHLRHHTGLGGEFR